MDNDQWESSIPNYRLKIHPAHKSSSCTHTISTIIVVDAQVRNKNFSRKKKKNHQCIMEKCLKSNFT